MEVEKVYGANRTPENSKLRNLVSKSYGFQEKHVNMDLTATKEEHVRRFHPHEQHLEPQTWEN